MASAAAASLPWSPMSWSADDVIAATGATIAAAAPDVDTIESICTDTRRLAPGSLFVALRGPNHDGHLFAAGALSLGATAVLLDTIPDGVEAHRAFVVPDTLRALGDLASWTRRRWGGRVVAITGSNGKTTTKEMLAVICEKARLGAVLKTQGNLNNLIGLPLTLLGLAGEEAVAVLEMGMNAPGEIARLTEIARPDLGLVTNVGAAHLEGLGSVAGVAAAKGELFAGMRSDATIAVNMDDRWTVRIAADFVGRRIEFGRRREVTALDVRELGWDGTAFTLEVAGNRQAVRLPMPGLHNVSNALAAAAAAHGLGIDVSTIAAGLEAATPPPMRTEIVSLANGVTLLNDAYNANPTSMAAALEAIARMPGRSIAVLGEMRELGHSSSRLHRQLGQHAVECGIAVLVAVGPLAEEVAAGARAADAAPLSVHVCANAALAADLLQQIWQSGDSILVKGSRGSDTEEGVRLYGARMVEVVRRLEKAAGAV